MPRYKVTAFTGLTLPSGTVLQLSDAQLRLRRHQVRDRDDGLHEAAEPLSFKAGEILDLKDPLPKAAGDEVEDLTPDAAQAGVVRRRKG